MKIDGHIHSPYCPHGTTDTFKQYINRALELGFSEISFTEHAPLPEGFIDPTPDKDSGMNKDYLPNYLNDLTILKEQYRDKIKINIGLEVDYIVGFEDETRNFLNIIGPQLDDSILSVHFLKNFDQYFCMDFSDEVFAEMIEKFGSVETVYQTYYDAVLRSIQADLGYYKPKRIGHITLARKFQKKYPCELPFDHELEAILLAMKDRGFQLDYNGAGTVKPLCGEPYPSEDIIKRAMNLGIPLVYGSDAHQAKDLGQGFSSLYKQAILTSPTKNN